MRLSTMLGKTTRQVPAEADTISHQLMLKTGMIYQVATGIYAYLPLGWRAINKVCQVIRNELDIIGGQELSMSVLQPMEIWRKTGRDTAFGDNLFTLKDRRDREFCLGPTHEELITTIVASNVRSYRDLPLLLYQIQTKFRDEPRPRGGLIRVREFDMMDLYSFDADEESLDKSYNSLVQAYKHIYACCGLSTTMVEADSGAIGGKDSHEFMLPLSTGEDEIIFCSECGYSANVEKAESTKLKLRKEQTLPLQEIATPGKKTIEEVADFFKVSKEHTIKTLVYSADDEIILVVIRGDLDINEIKLKNSLKCHNLRLASDEETMAQGFIVGAISPVGISGIKVISDDSITPGNNYIAGANKAEYHFKNVNYPRDFHADTILDIAAVKAGHKCPKCGEKLQSQKGIEIGHTFKLGTVFSEKLDAKYLDKDGTRKPILMGCYGIGIGRLLAAIIEQNHDDKGIIWPINIAPFQVHLCALTITDQQVQKAAEELYQRLIVAGLDVLYDDRQESAGIKFNDADLLGMPVRLTISPRTVKANQIELKWRSSDKIQLIAPDDIAKQLEVLTEG